MLTHMAHNKLGEVCEPLAIAAMPDLPRTDQLTPPKVDKQVFLSLRSLAGAWGCETNLGRTCAQFVN